MSILGTALGLIIGYSLSPAQLAMHYEPGSTQGTGPEPDEVTDNVNQELHGKALSWFEKGNAWMDRGRLGFPKALEAYRKAWELNPNNADLHYQMGRACQLTGNTKEAMEHYREANRLDSYYRLLTLPLLAHDLHIRGEFADAITLYQEALEELRQVKRHRREVRQETARIELAIRQCHNAIQQSLDRKVMIIVQP